MEKRIIFFIPVTICLYAPSFTLGVRVVPYYFIHRHEKSIFQFMQRLNTLSLWDDKFLLHNRYFTPRLDRIIYINW